MKNYSIIVLLITLSCSLNAQTKTKDTVSVSIGLMLTPNGAINFRDSTIKFKTTSGIFLVSQIVYKKTVFTPFYNMTANSVGGAVYYSFVSNFGSYIVGTKNVFQSGGYLGAGVGTPVASGRATFFVEFGSTWNSWDPGIYVGVFIPFVKKVN